MVKSRQGPNESEHTVLSTNIGHRAVRTARRRDILNLSARKATVTSEIDTVEVTAATSNSRKKSDDHSCYRGNRPNTSGKVTKISDAPSMLSFSRPKVLTAGNITNPISNATSKLSRATVIDVRGKLVEIG